ncbi:MAG: beta-galactosidase [Chloroflexota bacterium]|nr:beta-galactosidase [Chloroflexota bacterium]
MITIDRYTPLNARCPHMLHGGDYYPDQWLEPVWEGDMRLMKLAHCNAMSIGIFAWTRLEPVESHFDFDWLDRVIDMLAENGVYAILATPSGARPVWMSAKYPEVLRVSPDRRRILHGQRHNHCFTSPIYREKCGIINARLAERYKDHPALLLWHISNEYGGECHCDLCQEAFRDWLQCKYESLNALNHAWWTSFWSHTYTDWSQIESPSPIGESLLHGLNLDWKRFVTDQTADFMRNEMAPLREITPDVPVTTNFMGIYDGLDYWKLAQDIDIVSWDNYPEWPREPEDWSLAADIGFIHDLNRCLKGGQPFMLMESSPSVINWRLIAKIKRPGTHALSSLQAIAHGSDTVLYFQWRMSRGGSEKFHGAVVSHTGDENTRVFKEVVDVGQFLEQLDDVVGTTVRPETAIIYDWENNWALTDAQGPSLGDKGYLETSQRFYRAFWSHGIPIDVINMDQDLSHYKLVVAPMLYMLRPGIAQRLEAFVGEGGTLVTTYLSGRVDENDLCFLDGFPGPLRQILGIWVEEIDALYEHDINYLVPVSENPLGLHGQYAVRDFCDLIHAESAEVLATYRDDFYAGRPALTVNRFGDGQTFYIASRNDDRFLDDFMGVLGQSLKLKRALDADLPQGVTAQLRTDGKRRFVFLLNFTASMQHVEWGKVSFTDLLTGQVVHDRAELPPYGVMVLAETNNRVRTLKRGQHES